MKDDISNITLLGSKKTDYKNSGPSASILETFPNKFPEVDYLITHETSEFSSLCPKTGQPDFATIKLEYVADEKCIESKSLKLYFFSYREEGSFMETICNCLLKDFVSVCSPRWMKVTAIFNARGGIQTTVEAEHQA